MQRGRVGTAELLQKTEFPTLFYSMARCRLLDGYYLFQNLFNYLDIIPQPFFASANSFLSLACSSLVSFLCLAFSFFTSSAGGNDSRYIPVFTKAPRMLELLVTCSCNILPFPCLSDKVSLRKCDLFFSWVTVECG